MAGGKARQGRDGLGHRQVGRHAVGPPDELIDAAPGDPAQRQLSPLAAGDLGPSDPASGGQASESFLAERDPAARERVTRSVCGSKAQIVPRNQPTQKRAVDGTAGEAELCAELRHAELADHGVHGAIASARPPGQAHRRSPAPRSSHRCWPGRPPSG